MRIRNETPADFREVEVLTRNAFWNVNAPGCDEHYLVHILRDHADFIPALDLVIELDGRLIANVMYTRAKLIGADGREKDILTFGPLSVLPEYQRQGYGKALLQYSFEKAVALGFDAVVIFGNPENYICSGFQCCEKFGVHINGVFPTAMLVKELRDGAIPAGAWEYRESAAYQVDAEAAAEFDRGFEPREKGYAKSQELFYIYSRSRVSPGKKTGEIRKVTGDKKVYLDLLLLADEQESMIDRYLEAGEMFVLDEDGVKGECVVTKEAEGVYELKNIAVWPEFQRRGYGKRLVGFAFEHYPDCRTMRVGTGDCPSSLAFYHACGFFESHRIKNFFTDNYDHEMFEDGVQLVDMVYLKREK